jgi:hypothetical protein
MRIEAFLRGSDTGRAAAAGDPAALQEAARALHQQLGYDLEELRRRLENSTTAEHRRAVGQRS